MTDIASRAEGLRVELQAVVDQLPGYAARPVLTIGAGIRLATLVRDLATRVEEWAAHVNQKLEDGAL